MAIRRQEIKGFAPPNGSGKLLWIANTSLGVQEAGFDEKERVADVLRNLRSFLQVSHSRQIVNILYFASYDGRVELMQEDVDDCPRSRA